MSTEIRLATMADCPAITRLVAESARGLGKPDYTDEVIEAALKGIWGLDTQLVKDGTYFLVYVDNELAACGGWSFRTTLFGSDKDASRDAAPLDPATDPARIRAFFVLPKYARQGIGSALIARCEEEARRAGFRSLSLGSTLPGQRLYAAHGFIAGKPVDHDRGDGVLMQVIPMTKQIVADNE
jgi:GNAT superfamily N-acetyltransferase